MDLNFKVENQKLNRTDNNTLVNLSENYLRLCFTFSEDWNTFAKFALFKHDDQTTRIGLVEDKISIPSSLLTSDKIIFSLYGLKTENDTIHRITTNMVRLQLLDSGFTQDVDDPIDDEEVDIVEEIYIAIAAKSDTTYVDEQLALKTNVSDIRNNLTSNDTNKPLSAKQGKELKTLIDTKADDSDTTAALNGKVSYDDVIDNVTSTFTGKPLSAKQGKVLKDLVDENNAGTISSLGTKVAYTDVKDNLTSMDTDKPLSAKQGKLLKDLVDSIDVVKRDTAEDGYFATYNIKVNGVVIGDKINIPKDYLLKDADIKVCEEDDVPVEGYVVGDYYFDFLVNTVGDDDPKHLYLLCNILKDVYSGDGSTIVITDCVVSVKENVFADKIHTHTESDITDLKDYSEVGHTHKEEDITDLKDYSEVGHTHTKSDVTDFSHTHTKSEITDFSHDHDDRYYTEDETDTLLNAKSNTGHNHDDRYYTESEVDAIIDGLNNRLSIDADKTIIQTDDKLDVVAYRVKNGVPQADKDIYFYIKEDVNDDSDL